MIARLGADHAENLSSEKIVPGHRYVISRVSTLSHRPSEKDLDSSRRFVQSPVSSNSYSVVESKLPSREISLPFKSWTLCSQQRACSSPHSVSVSTLSAK